MQSMLNLAPADFAGLRYPCSCGRTHGVDIQKILIESGCIVKLPEVIRELGGKHVFILADNNTYAVCGEQVEALLSENGITHHSRVFVSETPLVPNEYAVGSALAAMEMEDDMILAIGSGTLNDTARLLSARTRLPYVIVATAPSMDGFASTVSPLILDGMKITIPAVYPVAIVADTAIMKDAPMPMLTAGFGDIIGKYTALADWRLARDINGEYYCNEVVELVEKAVEKCAANAAGLCVRDEEAVKAVTEALILSGIAIGLVGVSRPASGAEHHFSHYWEVIALQNGEEHPLHGNSVGVAAVISASLYELAKDELPENFVLPDKAHIIACQNAADACVDPKALGITKELFHESVLHAMEIRERYTILRFLDHKGLLPAFADILTERFYGETV
ncbi:MAG: sn-glycerol-1-phosphate dehydrogenase [Clostridia bacterium]|nr:sn-glycerol-1-phosphate dehydrogenase [Clostridia bacterium]